MCLKAWYSAEGTRLLQAAGTCIALLLAIGWAWAAYMRWRELQRRLGSDEHSSSLMRGVKGSSVSTQCAAGSGKWAGILV